MLHYFLKNIFKGFQDLVFGYVYLRKIYCRFQYVNLGILAFHSHLTPLELCSSARTKSHMDTHASGIKHQRK